MGAVVRSLPVVQNWDCHGCGGCCREYTVHVTDAERARVEALPEAKQLGVPAFARAGRGWALNQRDDGACVFLGGDGLCRIHAAHGPAVKPLACRVFPFVPVPVGDHWRVGIRFACPSVSANRGRPLAAHEPELAAFARGLAERHDLDAVELPAPPLRDGQAVPWSDLALFVKALLAVLKDRADPVERRLRKGLALAAVCRSAMFETITGPRLVEFLALVRRSLDADAPADPAAVPPPDWAARVLFRQYLALVTRKDEGAHRGVGRRGFLTRTWAAWRFLRGTGPVPRLHAAMPEVTFGHVESARGPLPDGAEELLERYYRVKVESMQFVGRPNFGLPFWDGFDALALTYPAVAWLTRALHDRPPAEALQLALQIVDDSFGFHPLLGTARQKAALRVLSARGRVASLVAHYAR